MIKWILVDYGEVLSLPMPSDTIDELAVLARQDSDEFVDHYWRKIHEATSGANTVDRRESAGLLSVVGDGEVAVSRRARELR